jgi:isocitrate dehydrogenase kinase/phosphatase
VRKAFLKHHRDLLEPGFWQETQARIRAGYVEDFYPYPLALRFCNLFPAAADAKKASASETV